MSLTIYMQYVIAMQYLGLEPATRQQLWAEIQQVCSRDANPFDDVSAVDYSLGAKPCEGPLSVEESDPYDFTLTDDFQRCCLITNHAPSCRCSSCLTQADD